MKDLGLTVGKKIFRRIIDVVKQIPENLFSEVNLVH